MWIDDPQFNLDYHVRHTALPEPGSEQQLRTLAARIFSQRLDRSKPLWEMWLVDGLEGGRFAIVTKSHHCLIDGVSGVDITTVLFDAEARRPHPVGSRAVGGRVPSRSDAQMLGRALAERAITPAEAVRGVRAPSFASPRKIARSMVDASSPLARLRARAIAAPDSPFNVPISPYRRFAWVRGDLDELQAHQEHGRRHRQRRRSRRRRRRARAASCEREATRPRASSSRR